MIYAIENLLGSRGNLSGRRPLSGCAIWRSKGRRVRLSILIRERFFGSCGKRGILIGIMTRNCRAAIRRVFPDMAAYVDAVATREDVPLVKPDPGTSWRYSTPRRHGPLEGLPRGRPSHRYNRRKERGLLTAGVLTGRTERPAFRTSRGHFHRFRYQGGSATLSTHIGDRMREPRPTGPEGRSRITELQRATENPGGRPGKP